MTDSEIKEFIVRLDSATPKEAAEVMFQAFGETAVYANRAGYLRLGIEFLKCAMTGTDEFPNIDYMISADSEFSIDHFTGSREELDSISS